MSDMHHAGTVAIVGRPNVGKSTLLNSMVGQKISITSRKPQTTRQRITGILTRDDGQLVFVDTPGFQTQQRNAMTRIMNRSVTQALQEVDAVLWVVEALKFGEADEALRALLPRTVPLVIAVSKIDLLSDKSLLLPFIKMLDEQHRPAAIVPLSSRSKRQIDALAAALVKLLPEGPPLFDADEITTASERFLAAELIREKLFRLLGEELPYSAAVEIDRFETAGRLRRIYASVIVDKPSQKGIVVGKGGEKLKMVGTQARKDMEQLFGGRVFLELWVKVKGGWADSAATLKRMGFDT